MQNLLSYFIFNTLLFLSAATLSNGVTAAAAGVLIFTEVDDTQYVLLADHKSPVHARGWGILAGVVEDSESSLDAAIRETVEESNGAFDGQSLRNSIDLGNYVHYSDFTSYFVKVEFEPANIYSYTVANDAKGVNGERGPFVWIPWVIVSAAAKDAAQLGDDCWDQPIAIPPEYLPGSKQSSWFFCAFLELATVVDLNGGLPESNKTLQRTSR